MLSDHCFPPGCDIFNGSQQSIVLSSTISAVAFETPVSTGGGYCGIAAWAMLRRHLPSSPHRLYDTHFLANDTQVTINGGEYHSAVQSEVTPVLAG